MCGSRLQQPCFEYTLAPNEGSFWAFSHAQVLFME